MRFLKTALVGVAGLAASMVAAQAADPVPIPVVVAPVVPPPAATTLSAYVELFAGHISYRDDFDDDEFETGRGWGFGGLGKAAWNASPSFAVQFDVWAEHWSGTWAWFCDGPDDPCEEGTWDDNLMGIATHLIFGDPGGFRFGGMLSIGDGDFNTHVNLAGEAAFSTGNMRFGLQAGYSFGIGDYGQEWKPRNLYAQAVVAFYPTSNIAISANAGVNRYRELNDDDYVWTGVNWGARVEFQPAQMPLTIFAAYQGERRYWVDGDTDKAHFIGVGVGLLVGQPNIQARDNAIGFGDYNPLFGPTFRR
ncbi:MAG: hypothetical protein AB7G07_06795 [Bauldia sp.]